MAEEQEEVDGLGCGDSFLEPVLLHHCFGRDDFGDVRVAGEVIEDAEGHDPQSFTRASVRASCEHAKKTYPSA